MIHKMANGPNILCCGCGAVNNRLNPFCDRCAGPWSDGKTLTTADKAYLEWKAAKDGTDRD